MLFDEIAQETVHINCSELSWQEITGHSIVICGGVKRVHGSFWCVPGQSSSSQLISIWKIVLKVPFISGSGEETAYLCSCLLGHEAFWVRRGVLGRWSWNDFSLVTLGDRLCVVFVQMSLKTDLFGLSRIILWSVLKMAGYSVVKLGQN